MDPLRQLSPSWHHSNQQTHQRRQDTRPPQNIVPQEDSLVFEIKRKSGTHFLLQYIQYHHKEFKPFHWVATLNKLKQFDENPSSRLNVHDIQRFNVVFAKAIADEFSWKQLNLTVDFLQYYRTDISQYQRFMQALLQKTTSNEDFEHLIKTYGPSFSAGTWITAIKKGVIFNFNVDHLLKKWLNPQMLGTRAEIIALSQYLKAIGSEYCLPETKGRLDPEHLTFQLKKYAFKDENTFLHYLNFVSTHVDDFNSVHWAVFAGALHKASELNINLKLWQETIRNILAKFSICSDIFCPGQIAQITGGFLVVLAWIPEVSSSLLSRFLPQVTRFEKREFVMVLHALRKAPESEFLLDYLQGVAKYLLEPNQKSRFSKDLDLYTTLIHCSAKLNSPFLQPLEKWIVSHVQDLNVRDRLEILEALGMVSRSYIFSKEAIVCLLSDLHLLIGTIRDPKEKIFAIVRTAANIAKLRYLSAEWTQYCLKASEELNFAIWDKINLALSFTTLGQLNENTSEQMRQYVKSIAVSYCDAKFDYLRVQYPSDGVKLAFIVASLFKESEQELTHKLISLAIPGVTKDNDIDLSMMRQAIELTEFQKKNPDCPVYILNFVHPDDSVTVSNIQKKITAQLTTYVNSHFENAKITCEALTSYSFVDVQIENVSKDGKPIFIEVDGPAHRSVNLLQGKKWGEDMGRTQIKHHVLKKLGHLIPIRADRYGEPNDVEEIDAALKKLHILAIEGGIE